MKRPKVEGHDPCRVAKRTRLNADGSSSGYREETRPMKVAVISSSFGNDLNKECSVRIVEVGEQSDVQGVSWDPKKKSWRSELRCRGTQYSKFFKPKDETPMEMNRARHGAEEQRRVWERETSVVKVAKRDPAEGGGGDGSANSNLSALCRPQTGHCSKREPATSVAESSGSANILWNEIFGRWQVTCKADWHGSGRLVTVRRLTTAESVGSGGGYTAELKTPMKIDRTDRPERTATTTAAEAVATSRGDLVRRRLLKKCSVPLIVCFSDVPGVSWDGMKRIWRAEIQCRGTRFRKTFRLKDDTPDEMSRAKRHAEEQRKRWEKELNVVKIEVAPKPTVIKKLSS